MESSGGSDWRNGERDREKKAWERVVDVAMAMMMMRQGVTLTKGESCEAWGRPRRARLGWRLVAAREEGKFGGASDGSACGPSISEFASNRCTGKSRISGAQFVAPALATFFELHR